MNRRLPQPIEDASVAVTSATHALILAAQQADAEAIEDAVGRREKAVRALTEAIDRHRSEIGDHAGRELMQSLALHAGEAEQSLKKMMQDGGASVRTLKAGARAVRGYASHVTDPSSLDRSG